RLRNPVGLTTRLLAPFGCYCRRRPSSSYARRPAAPTTDASSESLMPWPARLLRWRRSCARSSSVSTIPRYWTVSGQRTRDEQRGHTPLLIEQPHDGEQYLAQL